MIVRILLFVCCSLPGLAAPQSDSPQEISRRVQTRLLSPCCYRQSVADHSSPEAARMRAEIESPAASGQNERQIVDVYKARYGVRILGEPEGLTFWIATLVPAIAAAVGLCFLLRTLYATARHRTTEAT